MISISPVFCDNCEEEILNQVAGCYDFEPSWRRG